ncbi:MAG: SIS domain-containing protein, partial [Frankiales bacterium]|nr:SIS domain-containing protein [Frankiales bacterium]
MSHGLIDERLDDVEAITALDAQQMLRAVATSAAQIRQAITASADAGVERLREDGRPRALVVTGMGGSGIAGDVVGSIAAAASPVPVLTHRGTGLPGWVGAADAVVAVSCSGRTRETLSTAEEAVRRGCRLIVVAADDSPLAELSRQVRGLNLPATMQLSPRSSMWALATPVLLVAQAFGLLDLGPGNAHLEDAAGRLEQIAEACRPDRESFVNPAKALAIELAGSVPM